MTSKTYLIAFFKHSVFGGRIGCTFHGRRKIVNVYDDQSVRRKASNHINADFRIMT